MKPNYVILVLLVFSILGCSAARMNSNKHTAQNIISTIDSSFQNAILQYRFLKSNLPINRFPKSYDANGKGLITSSSRDWTSGFYPGALIYLYEESGDQKLFDEAKVKLQVLDNQKFNNRTHDLGFMMYCSFGNAYRLTKDIKYKEVLIESAKSLASRYNPRVKSIQSWDRIKSFVTDDYWDFPVIIDNMMNLELLFFASKATGDQRFKDFAMNHAETAMKNHVRPDYSAYHVVVYNPENGEVVDKQTYQGFAHNSAWSRGQGWGIYGFTMVYRETGDKRFLKTAQGMADFFLDHQRLPQDKIPYWDFNAGQDGFPSSWNYDASKYPIIPRDASAAALVASALIELSQYVEKTKSAEYLSAAETMIKSLSTPTYSAAAGQNGGFILKHGVGNLTKDREVDAPLSYADYYYIEAMSRYKKLKDGKLNL
ncbi:glycoside hydrolase family 88 protein [Sphingobacterium hotanense]|uniref:glycoside hydrolase family 88 protein n=1 Tax=Sphingobacterium hotanense TaxID=649196 RepID=UPI0021A4A781|nr:glycoside hydrolase family 88 protein [Sphingobacterium hotanense]MCT1524891.1 glycoside hydrolase family 88 protein [Sphingobacterium hotanense]